MFVELEAAVSFVIIMVVVEVENHFITESKKRSKIKILPRYNLLSVAGDKKWVV